MAIPRRIIQSHESEYTFNSTFATCRKKLLKLHQDYDYQFFPAHQRREFIRERRPELLDLYDFYPRDIQRADLFRVIAVFELGGFYLDLDVHPYVPLDELCEATLVLTEEWKMTREQYEDRHWHPPAHPRDLLQVGNYGFAAEAGHWFMEEVIDETLCRAGAINPSTIWNNDVLFSTGPDVINAVYARHRDRLKSEVTILRGPKHDPWRQFGKFGTHLMAGSWG